MWKLRDVITALLLVSVLHKSFLILSKGFTLITGLASKLGYIFRLAARASSMLSKSMLVTLPFAFAKVFSWVGIVTTALTALYFIYKKLHKTQVNYLETQLKEIASEKKRYSILIKNNEQLNKLTNEELENVKAKIKAKGATKNLIEKQDLYKTSIKETTDKIKELNFQMGLLEVQKNKITFGDTAKEFTKLMTEYKAIVGYGLGAKKIISTGMLTKPEFPNISSADFDKVNQIRKDDVKSWEKYRDRISAVLTDIIDKQLDFNTKYAIGAKNKNSLFTSEAAKKAQEEGCDTADAGLNK